MTDSHFHSELPDLGSRLTWRGAHDKDDVGAHNSSWLYLVFIGMCYVTKWVRIQESLLLSSKQFPMYGPNGFKLSMWRYLRQLSC